MRRCETVIRERLSAWTTAFTRTLHFLRKCLKLPLEHWENARLARRLLGLCRRERLWSALTGTLDVVATLVRTGGSTVAVLSAQLTTEQRTMDHASHPSRPGEAAEHQIIVERVRQAAEGTRRVTGNGSLKRKATDDIDLPRFRRGFAWSDQSPHMSPSALYTETAPPLPSPPEHLLNDPIIQAALRASANHIKVTTTFDVDKFERMLSDHPNQPFVQSVLKGMREGFWPCDEGDWKLELKEIIDNQVGSTEDLQVLRAFRDREIEAGRWSLPIPALLPGMKVSPMFVAWQNEKPRVITDHARSHVNDGIPAEEGKVKYDDMRSFGGALHHARLRYPGCRLILYKDDVATAFLNLPVHPIWQLRQVVGLDGVFHIVWRLIFGNRASPRVWCSVSGLICWLGIRKLSITDLHVYMDDFYGWDFADNLVWFHGRLRPRRQVQLLLLWEGINCPYEDKKQDHGETLKIIGFWVDINVGSIALAPSSVTQILVRIDSFLSTTNRKPPLREWLRLAGHLNWLLNVLPWGRPALTEMYRKVSGKNHLYRGIHINAKVTRDLLWLKDTIPRSLGVLFTDVGRWSDSEADMVVWTDACLQGLSFVYAGNGFMYQLQPPPSDIKVDIFFLELVAILSAISHVTSLPIPPRRLLLHTDSLDSVAAFNSLRVSESIHNGPLLGTAQLILTSRIDLRVRHIEGKLNIRADMLSRLLLEEYRHKFPSDRVRLFTPPRELLPARWRECF
jgi:hypothetical protein